MNLSKYIGKTFPAGKSAKELGIDTSRKFVLTRDIQAYRPVGRYEKYSEGLVFTVEDANPEKRYATFVCSSGHDGETFLISWKDLAYLEEEDEVCLAEGVSTIEIYDTPKDMLHAFGQKVLSDPTVSEVTIAVGKQIDKPSVPRVGDRVRLEEDEKIEYTVDPEKDVDTTDFLSGMNYIPRLGDKVRLEGKIRKIHAFNFCTVEVQEKYELTLKTSSLALISRAPRTLTKAEAEKMLSEKLGEEITIE